MTASSLVKRTLLFFYLFSVLPKAYADPVSKKSTYSFTSGSSQHNVEFTAQRNEESLKYTASTITTGTVCNRGVSNNVEGVFKITTAISEPNSPSIRITASNPLPGSSLHVMSTSVQRAPLLNQELINDLRYSVTAEHEGLRLSSRTSADYTLPLSAFRVNDLIVVPLLTDPVVARRNGNIVRIRTQIPVFSISPYRFCFKYLPEGGQYDSYTFGRSFADVLIDIRCTGEDSVRVETIRTIGSGPDHPDFNLSFLSEEQTEPLRQTLEELFDRALQRCDRTPQRLDSSTNSVHKTVQLAKSL